MYDISMKESNNNIILLKSPDVKSAPTRCHLAASGTIPFHDVMHHVNELANAFQV